MTDIAGDTAKKREKLAEIVKADASSWGLGWVSPVEIDEIGMSESLRLAARRAVEEAQGQHAKFSQIIIDGKVNFLAGTRLERYVSTAIKADDLIKEVSAASIIAKVARDAYMMDAGAKFPGYGFEKHMGYGTAAHMRALREMGICPEHRRSFEPIRSMVGFERGKSVVKNTTSIGVKGEEAVSEYLVRQGHRIVARNFRTYFYEIDIVSVKDEILYFTEVKTRKNDYAGGGIAAINSDKLRRMRYAAESYMKYRGLNVDARLAVASVNRDYEVEDWFAI